MGFTQDCTSALPFWIQESRDFSYSAQNLVHFCYNLRVGNCHNTCNMWRSVSFVHFTNLTHLPFWWEVVSSSTHITTKIVSTYHRWCLTTTLWTDILLNTLKKSCQITSHPCKEILQIHSTLTVYPVTVLLQNWQLGNMVSATSSVIPYVRTLLELTITDKCLQSLTCTGSWVHRESVRMNSYRLWRILSKAFVKLCIKKHLHHPGKK